MERPQSCRIKNVGSKNKPYSLLNVITFKINWIFCKLWFISVSLWIYINLCNLSKALIYFFTHTQKKSLVRAKAIVPIFNVCKALYFSDWCDHLWVTYYNFLAQKWPFSCKQRAHFIAFCTCLIYLESFREK